LLADVARLAGRTLRGLPVPLEGNDTEGWHELLATPVRKAYVAGTQRACAPSDTLTRIRPHLASMGITRVANVTGLDRIGVPVVVVCRPNSRSLATSQGKGLDLDAAAVSGLMESIELHHAERIMLPLAFASMAELASSRRLVDVSRLPRIVNSRFHEHLPLLWIEGHDVLGGRPAWLPFETVHASAAMPAPNGSGCFAATSNGLASGNNRIEAMVHALLEVIERDATALWGARGEGYHAHTTVDISTIDDPACRSVIDACATAGADVAVFDTTADTGIPSFLCEVSEAQLDPRSTSVFTGLGCHVDKGVALLRALTEAVQSRLTLITGSRDDLSRRDYRVEAAPTSRSAGSCRSFEAMSSLPAAETFNEDLELICERLRAVGVEEVLVVDLTRADYAIPVVRVVVPGLEGPDDDPEYVPGRRASAARAGTS